MTEPDKPEYSVLILGETQAGKSSLIEHIRSYADPGYAIDRSFIGCGSFSKTDSTTPIVINSNLPSYEAYRKDTGEIFDLKNLATQYQDEDDYQDILLSRSNDVAIRSIHQDPNAPSESMKFRFLDTPGLNGTQGRDSEHAVNIVNEIISTRSFNLVVFVISSQSMLTEEKRLALEYFAFVLRGLHSKIVFLYTHIEYLDTHTTNKKYLYMENRNEILSKICRRHDSESGFNEDNIIENNNIEGDIDVGDIAERKIKLYPSFTIDLVTRQRPIVQCLIRSTIREILMMAMAPPAVLDISALNIQRIRAVIYPNKFGQEQRETFESELRAVYNSKWHQVNGKYSVLIIGKTQTGKSTLKEHIKNYANPSYSMDLSLLGNGRDLRAESARPFFIESTLPAYEAYRKKTGEVIDLTDLATRCEDEEDYREILFSREKDVGLRTKPQDDKTLSETVEFRFLDTPGPNDTNDRGSSHAVNVISEMINTLTFNLIVVIVSYKNPLTQEQQLSLEYYANVLQGLHSRIMFLHTHVDYADVHHTNITHHFNMKMKNRSLSKIFRRHDNEAVFDEDDFQEYPSLTIDLVSKKRPVINCLIRNTIREIVKMAIQPAVVLDTSIQNIDRIRAIPHPSKFNYEQHKAVKARFAAEAAKFEKSAEEEEEADVGGQELEQINILLIGDVQSGKTSLVETFRLYADPAYTAKTEHITQGTRRFADERVKITTFLADLHTVEIRKLRQSTGGYDLIDLDEEAKRLSEEDFEDLLNLGPKGAETVIIASNGAKKYRFNIYEGPSLNESADNFEKNIFSVHRTLVESDQKFHQVLFTLAPGLITSPIRTTIRICSDILSNLSSLFSFVHTKFNYINLHIGNKQFRDLMKERQELLQRCIQSSATPYLIDCNLQSKWPVQRGKTYSVVHNILNTAIGQTPIALKSPIVKVTPKMVLVDTELKWQARDAFQDTKKEITQNNKDLLELRGKVRQLDIDYKAKNQVVNSAKSKEDVASRNDMEVVFEDKYTAAAEPHPEIHSRTMTFKEQPRAVEKVHMVCENVEIEQALGGSVLILGKQGSGKSTLIQHIKNYANPGYSIDRSLLGNGNLSKTESTCPFFVESNLPAYEAYRKDTGDVINLTDLSTRCEDEEDYREILFSRDKNVGFRIKPQDDKTLSETVEFRFLDTPGINDTNDSDSSHAVNIISEMINTRTFNLIVVIVSYRNPLTQEQQLALEYYANVLQGLHSRIMFLHTHVDYADVHHTNTTHHFNMKMKNRSLSKIFRRHDNETVFDEDDFQEYPSLTIDLISKKRPVINCLIRNTIREILKMATQSPVVLDTSVQNIVRIHRITHPAEFNAEQREKIKQRFAAEAAKHKRPAEAEETDVGGQDMKQIYLTDEDESTYEDEWDYIGKDISLATCSVLMFGKTQAGKSTFIEFVKNYANKKYTIDETLFGTGFMSKTSVPLHFSVKSNLPAYEVFDHSGTRIDIGSLGDKHRDPEDYLDALNDRKTTLKPVPHDPCTSPPRDVKITFLDTPGIEDTFGMDAEHAPKIIDAMAKMQAFNLIIVIINCQEQPSIAHQLAFNYYSKVIHAFQGHHSNIIFLYTHVDYDKCHHSDANHLATMKLQHEAFSQLFQFSEQSTTPGSFSRERVSKAKTTADTYHSFNIDFGRRRRPVAQCMRLMTLREILKRVVNSPPVVLDTSPGNLERIDSIIHPDKLNHEERNKILDSTRTILRRQQESSEAPEAASEGLNAQNDPNSGSGVECTFVDLSFSAHDDCEEYFRGVPQVDDLESEDEDGDRLASPGSSIGMEALLSRCQDTLSHEE